MLAEANLPPLPSGRRAISLDQRVLVIAAMKARDQGMSLTEFNARRQGLSREHLYRIAGVPLPDDLLGLPASKPTSPPSAGVFDLLPEVVNAATPPAASAPAPVAPSAAPAVPAPVVPAPAPVAPVPTQSSARARVWLRLPISEGVELHVAMGAVEARTLETIMAALRPLTTG